MRWCPSRDSNSESLASKASAFSSFATGAVVVDLGVEPSEPKQPIYSRSLRRTGILHRVGGQAQIRTENFGLLRPTRLPITPPARSYSPSRYRSRKVVWVAGFEPAASAFRGRPSTGLTIHPEKVGRGIALFMCAILPLLAGCATAPKGDVPVAISCVKGESPKPPATTDEAAIIAMDEYQATIIVWTERLLLKAYSLKADAIISSCK